MKTQKEITKTRKKIRVMQAWLNGKTIQVYNFMQERWIDLTEEPDWMWENMHYRIKPVKRVSTSAQRGKQK